MINDWTILGQVLAVAKLDCRDVMGKQGIDGQGTPAITTVKAAHDLGQHSEGLEEPSPSTDQPSLNPMIGT